MSLLNYYVCEDEIKLLTDSLMSQSSTLEPLGFTTKAYYIPHLEVLLAGTGWANILLNWYFILLTDFKYKHNENIYEYSRNDLKELYRKCKQENEYITTSTVYMFMNIGGKFKVIIQRSEKDWEIEIQEDVCGLKPNHSGLSSINEGEEVSEYINRIAFEQKRIDDMLDPPLKVGIGGSLILYHLDKKGLFVKNIGAL